MVSSADLDTAIAKLRTVSELAIILPDDHNNLVSAVVLIREALKQLGLI
jgi:hypothetical protein